MIELSNITKTFGPLKANDNITFTFDDGCIYAILGENGAGKSTLMKIIAGYQPPDPGGEIIINEQAVTIHSPHDALDRGIGMLYQDPLDFPPMTVLENYLTARPKQGFIPQRAPARAELSQIAQRLGFEFDPDALIETLTIGERQQLEIVRLLSLNVRFLILDEPTTGISAEQREQLFNALKHLAHAEKMTIVIVTHKLADVEELCDAVMVLRHGKITGTCSMPTPTAELVSMMFGEIAPQSDREDVPIGQTVMQIRALPVRTRLISVEPVSLDIHAGEVIGLAGLDGSGQQAFMRACAGLDRSSWQDHLLSLIAMLALLVWFDYLLGYSETVFQIAALVVIAVTAGPFLAAVVRWQRGTKADPIVLEGQGTRWLSYRNLRARGVAFLSAGRLEEGLVAGMTLTGHFALLSRFPWVNWLNAFRQTQSGIERYDIRGQAYSPIQTLSGGNQQRVALALLPENLKVVFLDNPTRGLDVNSARNIWQLMLGRRATAKTAIVFSSPDLDEIVQYSDRVMVFSSGRWTLVENPAEISAHRLGVLIGGKGSGNDGGKELDAASTASDI